MYQQTIKSPAWQLESVNDNGTVTFSSRNSGCADFIAIPASVIPKPETVLKRGILVKCDEMGHFVERLKSFDSDLPYHG